MRDEEYKALVDWIENALGRCYENNDGTIEISGGDFRYIVDIKKPSITMVCELSGKDRFGKHKIIPVEYGWRAKDYIDVLRDITSNDKLKRSIFMEKTDMKDMSLLEAKKILRNKGYILEAYDAVTDHRNYKFRNNKGFNHYRGFLLRNVVRELKNSNAKVLGIDNNTINIKNQNNEKFNVIFDNSIDNQAWRRVDNGEERELDNDNYSGKGVEMPDYLADYSEIENTVKVEILLDNNRIAISKFDVRNIPGMVDWIIDNI